MAGANPAYIVRQLGHSMAQMVFKVYARWLDGADWGREAAKLEAALSQNYPKE
jgi:integrase